ncbi:MAG: sigma-70 family RNA polymerase sigma factor [Patulibacter sp.]
MDVALIRLYRATHDRRRLEKLVDRFRPLVRSIALRYAQGGEPLDDVMQVALLGLVKAIERYEPQNGAGFGAFARPTIDGEIKRHLRDHGWAMKVPRSGKELWARLREARREHPTANDEQLASLLGIELSELRDAEANGFALQTESIDFRVGDDGGTVAERLGREESGYAQVEDHDEIDRAMSVLEPRDREVVRLRYFDEALQREIGDHIGTSQMQISRILNRSLQQMRDQIDVGPMPAPSSDDPSVPAP